MRLSLSLLLLALTGCPYVGFDSVSDVDGDGEASIRYGGDDCADDDPSIVDCDGDNDTFIDVQYPGGDDCNDASAISFPGAAEVCDDLDNNCDGLIDNDDPTLSGDVRYFPDQDGDSFGDEDSSGFVCMRTPAALGDVTLVENNEDCDDGLPGVRPGVNEVCDEIDNNCDGNIDDTAVGYLDADNDGYGVESEPRTVSCSASDEIDDGLAFFPGDCDDANPMRFPGNEEVHYNEFDENCNGDYDNWDADGDGWVPLAYEAQATVHNAANENRELGFGDCNDEEPRVNRGLPEICDDLDNDCDGLLNSEDLAVSGPIVEPLLATQVLTVFADGDEDEFYGQELQLCPDEVDLDEHRAVRDDCLDIGDANPGMQVDPAAVQPGATEVCDGVDNDCNGLVDLNDPMVDVSDAIWFVDLDGDGFGDDSQPTTVQCDQPPNSALQGGDCDDGDVRDFPTSLWYLDTDLDGFGSGEPVETEGCGAPTNRIWVHASGDCDETDESLNPETIWWVDADGDGAGDPGDSVRMCDPGDGFVQASVAREDCDDADSGSPVAIVYYLDEDGDGVGGASFQSCVVPAVPVTVGGDCDDNDGSIQTGCDAPCGPDEMLTQLYFDLDGDTLGLVALPQQSCVNPAALPIGTSLDAGDCNDADAMVLGVTDVWMDLDGDGLGDGVLGSAPGCVVPGSVTNGDDCDDSDPTIGAEALLYPDSDGDGAGQFDAEGAISCPIEDFVANADDCDDQDMAVVEKYQDLDTDGFVSMVVDCAGVVRPEDPVTMLELPFDCDDSTELFNTSCPSDSCPGDEQLYQNLYWDFDGDTVGSLNAPDQCGPPDMDPPGFSTNPGDCDDSDPMVLAADVLLWPDLDRDGLGDSDATGAMVCPGLELVANAGDCDDLSAAVGSVPGDYYLDVDEDGLGVGSPVNLSSCVVFETTSYALDVGDCDDDNPAYQLDCPCPPGEVERFDFFFDLDDDGVGGLLLSGVQCASVDAVVLPGLSVFTDDCDDFDASTAGPGDVWADVDGDGLGDGATSPMADQCPSNDFVANAMDCDDSRVEIGEDAPIYFFDADLDGLGAGSPMSLPACNGTSPSNLTSVGGDCDDTEPTLTTDCPICDAGDLFRSDLWLDADRDGEGGALPAAPGCYPPTIPVGLATSSSDCDDFDETVLAATSVYVDADMDGFGMHGGTVVGVECPSPGFAPNALDCVDNNPHADLVSKLYFEDVDMDGFGTGPALTFADCSEFPTAVQVSQVEGDCDDTDPTVQEGCPLCSAPEMFRDDLWLDFDGDGTGGQIPAPAACYDSAMLPFGVSNITDDCDDTNPSFQISCPCSPGETVFYADQDNDGVGDVLMCATGAVPSQNASLVPGDCDDANPNVNPFAPEMCGDGVDNDCDGVFVRTRGANDTPTAVDPRWDVPNLWTGDTLVNAPQGLVYLAKPTMGTTSDIESWRTAGSLCSLVPQPHQEVEFVNPSGEVWEALQRPIRGLPDVAADAYCANEATPSGLPVYRDVDGDGLPGTPQSIDDVAVQCGPPIAGFAPLSDEPDCDPNDPAVAFPAWDYQGHPAPTSPAPCSRTFAQGPMPVPAAPTCLFPGASVFVPNSASLEALFQCPDHWTGMVPDGTVLEWPTTGFMAMGPIDLSAIDGEFVLQGEPGVLLDVPGGALRLHGAVVDADFRLGGGFVFDDYSELHETVFRGRFELIPSVGSASTRVIVANSRIVADPGVGDPVFDIIGVGQGGGACGGVAINGETQVVESLPVRSGDPSHQRTLVRATEGQVLLGGGPADAMSCLAPGGPTSLSDEPWTGFGTLVDANSSSVNVVLESLWVQDVETLLMGGGTGATSASLSMYDSYVESGLSTPFRFVRASSLNMLGSWVVDRNLGSTSTHALVEVNNGSVTESRILSFADRPLLDDAGGGSNLDVFCSGFYGTNPALNPLVSLGGSSAFENSFVYAESSSGCPVAGPTSMFGSLVGPGAVFCPNTGTLPFGAFDTATLQLDDYGMLFSECINPPVDPPTF